VIVSSHILNEVERMATHVGIINKGSLVFQGPLHELQQLKTKQSLLEIETNDNARALQILAADYSASTVENKILMPFQNKEQAAAINKLLVQNGLDVYALHAQQSDLEQLFMEITSN
jgi:lantibiotic transport system ATP-binding protein